MRRVEGHPETQASGPAKVATFFGGPVDLDVSSESVSFPSSGGEIDSTVREGRGPERLGRRCDEGSLKKPTCSLDRMGTLEGLERVPRVLLWVSGVGCPDTRRGVTGQDKAGGE